MKGDFTRSTFKKENHYNSVRMQQGRVQLDADWNEQMEIQAYLDQTEAKDVIGRTGVPKYGGGFKVDASLDGSDLTISPGRIYVDGILCELENETTYLTQLDFPGAPEVEPGDYLAYLDVWQRHITALEDGNIREKALGGPDTATRAKTLWQVKLQSTSVLECNQIGADWQPNNGKEFGKLSARAKPGEVSEEPCILLPQGGYRRLENQLYRVEIHKNGTAGSAADPNNATFKWSRDNGSIVARVEAISGGEITISHPVSGRLEEFAPGQWIELSDDIHELHGKPGILVKISSVKAEKLTVDLTTKIGTDNIELVDSSESGIDLTKFYKDHNAKVRRWNSAGALEVNIPADNNGFIPLEDGVEIKFETGKDYQTGDYWLIPARSATADIEWPKDKTNPNTPVFKPRDGIIHHYCQLGLVNLDDTGFHFIRDCRDFFPPLNEVTIGQGCCTVTVGDGKSSFGDVDSLELAIGKVQQGGQICLLSGVHKTNVTIEKGKNITIRGCGKQTIVIPLEAFKDQPIFKIIDSRFITLENMDIMALEGTAIQVEKGDAGGSREIEISGNRIIALKHAVRVDDENGEKVKINGNRIRMVDKEDGDAAIYMQAKDSIIEGNDILVVPGKFPVKYGIDIESIYKGPPLLIEYMNAVWELTLNEYPSEGFNAPGGIQVAGGTDGIRIKENRVRGGYWNGITLGHIPLNPDTDADYNLLNRMKKTHYGINQEILSHGLKRFKENFVGFITNVEIEKNEIKYMGLNGIGVVNFFSLTEVGEMVSVDELTITGNTIVACLQQMPAAMAERMSGEIALAGISLADAENLVIRENRVEENGTALATPVCGIYIQHGDRIDISDNRILNNGPKSSKALTDKTSRIGGGIVIRFGIGKMITEFIEKIPFADGVPAVKIHDNIVTQPMGKALFIMALGPVSVVGNHLTSQGIDTKIKFYPMFAGSVMIINLGVSRDLFALKLIAALKSIISSTTEKRIATETKDFKYDTARGRVYYTTFASAPATLLSLRRCGEPSIPIPGAPTGPGDFGIIDPGTGPVIEILVYLPTGNVLFGDNRTTLDLRSQEQDFAISSQLIFSLDDISYVGNQSECNSRIDMVLADVFTIGNTIRTNDNRFQEGLTIALFSLLSIGILMNTWTGNQATHCLTAIGIKEETQDNNIVLLDGIMGFPVSDILNCRGFKNMLNKMLKPGSN
jgi:hypothetical protein